MTTREVRELKILFTKNENWLLSAIKASFEAVDNKRIRTLPVQTITCLLKELSVSITDALNFYKGEISLNSDKVYHNDSPVLTISRKIVETCKEQHFDRIDCIYILKLFKAVFYRLFQSHLNRELYKVFTGKYYDAMELGILITWQQFYAIQKPGETEMSAEDLIREMNRYQTIFQSFFIPIILLDSDNNVLIYNEAASQLFYAFEINKPIDNNSAIWGRDLTIVTDKMKDLSLENGNKKEFETYLKTSSGERFFQVIIKIIGNHISAFKGKLIMLEDLTRRKEVENHLEVAKTRAEEADHLKTAFLANMSHEIRTPMNAILGFTELLLTGQITGTDKNEYLRLILKSGNDLLHIINDIIDISKLETKQLKITDKSCKPYELLSDLHKLYKGVLSRRTNYDVDLILNVEQDEKSATIVTDTERLKQVLSNLLSNALKFTEEGFIEFGYKLAQEDRIYFYVKDTGIGIPEKMQERIFERFTQIDDTYSKNPGGTGLGLTICKNIVQLLGGDIWVMSSVGEGSNFYFYLPLKKELEIEHQQDIPKNLLKKQIHYNWKDCTVLIAEDEATNYLYLKEILKRTGIKILWAKTGLDAINLTESVEDINLILMDIKMPELNGLEAAKYILKVRPGLPIIAQTAFAMEDDKELCLRIGFKEYLTKPINKGKLLQILNKYLRIKDHHRISTT